MSFNTASGMRSIAIFAGKLGYGIDSQFQYRKRYEVYCNAAIVQAKEAAYMAFQYRKRYEVYCNRKGILGGIYYDKVSIPQAV